MRPISASVVECMESPSLWVVSVLQELVGDALDPCGCHHLGIHGDYKLVSILVSTVV